MVIEPQNIKPLYCLGENFVRALHISGSFHQPKICSSTSPTGKDLLNRLPPTKFSYYPFNPFAHQKLNCPLLNNNFLSHHPIKTVFLVAVITHYHCCFHLIFLIHLSLIHRKLFLALKNLRLLKVIPSQVPTTQ